MKTEFVYIPFTVREDSVDTAKQAIGEFISHIRHQEPGTLFYASLQEKESPNRFAHFMAFADSTAHEHHGETPYVKKFVDILYPLCTEGPSPVFLNAFDICGAAAKKIIENG
jgi:quinol monooxygenase YgiN